MSEVKPINQILGIDDIRSREIFDEFQQYYNNNDTFSELINEFLNSSNNYQFEEVFLMGYYVGRQVEMNEIKHKFMDSIKNNNEDN